MAFATEASSRPMVGRYELVARIGSGGMAEVFRASTLGVEGFEKTVVLKRVRPEYARHANLRDQLITEAKLCSRLVHPHVVQTFDLIAEEDDLFIVMEHVRGADVLRILRRCAELRVRIPPAIVTAIVIGAAKALAYAHHATDADGLPLGIVHCDVSPSNILVSYDGAVKLADFGVARVTSLQGDGVGLGTRGRLRGKLGYMAPEVMLHGHADARADVFALGAILWEMLTLRRLFTGRSPADTMRNVASHNVGERFARHSHVDPKVQAIIARAVARRPEDRYPTGRALLDALLDYALEARLRVSDHEVAAFLAQLLPEPHEEELDDVVAPAGTARRHDEPPPLPPDAGADARADARTARASAPPRAEPPVSPGELEALVSAFEDEDEPPPAPGAAPAGDALGSAPLADDSALRLLPTFEELVTGQLGAESAADTWLRLGPELGPVAEARPVVAGTFERRTVLATVARLAARRATGLATFRAEDQTTRLYFEEGRLVHGSSDQGEELLGLRLVRGGYISPEQRERGLARSRAEGTRVGEALMALEAVTAAQLRHTLVEQLERRLTEVFRWPGGRCTWEPGVRMARPGAEDGVDPIGILTVIVRRHLDPAECIRWLFPWRDGAVQAVAGEFPLERLELADKERDAAVQVRRARHVRDVLSVGAKGGVELIRSLFLLLQTAHLRVRPGPRGVRGAPMG